MALWQVDGQLSQVDTLDQRASSGTLGITQKQDPSTTGQVIMKDAQIIVHDGTTNRILIGFGSGLF